MIIGNLQWKKISPLRISEEKIAGDRHTQKQWESEIPDAGRGGDDGKSIQDNDRVLVPARGISHCTHRKQSKDQKGRI